MIKFRSKTIVNIKLNKLNLYVNPIISDTTLYFLIIVKHFVILMNQI